MTGYMSSNAPVPVSLPLKKCNYGTILQVSFIILCIYFLVFVLTIPHSLKILGPFYYPMRSFAHFVERYFMSL
jgi:hypothetical protein